MENSVREMFGQRVVAILERYFRQNARPARSAVEMALLTERLWALVERRGLPRAVGVTEEEPPEMTKEEVAPLVAEVLAGVGDAESWATPVRQLVKACFQAVRQQCRDSYREADADGIYRRQVLGRVRERISGTHCVDCPYWTRLTPAQHEKFLARAWRTGGPGEFAAQRAVFLPEDFRALRKFLRDCVAEPA